MEKRNNELAGLIREIAQGLKRFNFPELKRPRVPPNAPATLELVAWGAKVYCFSWMRHVCTLLEGTVTLLESGNNQSARILARSIFELGAHAYYVTKHLKQHIQEAKFSVAWEFLTPIATGSRYMNEQIPEESELFPAPAHISKAIKCFSEVMPQSTQEDYSYLSEFCHPNVLAFFQYYEWFDPETVRFVDYKPKEGFLGATTAATIQGLLVAEELLAIVHEQDVRCPLVALLRTIAEKAGTTDTMSA